MSFIDSLRRYKNGTATPEERTEVEAELEKQAAIQEYLEAQWDADLPAAQPFPATGGPQVKRLKWRVRLKIWGTVLLCLLLVGAITAGTLAAIQKKSYNPNVGFTGSVEDGGFGAFYMDISTYVELHFPGYITDLSYATPDGLGSYQIRVGLQNLFTGAQETYTDRVVRGISTGDIGSFWHFPIANAFMTALSPQAAQEARLQPETEYQAYQREQLETLPASAQVAMFITFPRDYSLQEVAAFGNKIGGAYISYVGVRAGNYTGWNAVGFEPWATGIIVDDTAHYRDTYPYLKLNGNYEQLQQDPAPLWEQHMKSLLAYMADRPEFLNVFGARWASFYAEALEYVEQNGVYSYGVRVVGSVADMLKIIDREDVYDFYVQDVKVSALSRS